MPLRLYNTLTRDEQEFVPLDPAADDIENGAAGRRATGKQQEDAIRVRAEVFYLLEHAGNLRIGDRFRQVTDSAPFQPRSCRITGRNYLHGYVPVKNPHEWIFRRSERRTVF